MMLLFFASVEDIFAFSFFMIEERVFEYLLGFTLGFVSYLISLRVSPVIFCIWSEKSTCALVSGLGRFLIPHFLVCLFVLLRHSCEFK